MTKSDCFLLFLILGLTGGLVFTSCLNQIEKRKNEARFEYLQKQIISLEEKCETKDKKQDDLIGSIIRTEAMSGAFDRRDGIK